MEQSPSWKPNRFSASQEIPPPHFMEPEGSLPHSQVPPPLPIMREIDPVIQSMPPHPTAILILSFHLRLGLPSGLFPSGFPTKTMYMPFLSLIRATCPAHLILLDSIIRTILVLWYVDEYGPNNILKCHLLRTQGTYISLWSKWKLLCWQLLIGLNLYESESARNLIKINM